MLCLIALSLLMIRKVPLPHLIYRHSTTTCLDTARQFALFLYPPSSYPYKPQGFLNVEPVTILQFFLRILSSHPSLCYTDFPQVFTIPSTY